MGNGKVLVTGATGYAAGHCIAELLAHGYDVRGTVRNLKTADVAHLRALPEAEDGSTSEDGSASRNQGALELVAANLDADEGWVQAAGGCDYVLHVASPIPFKAPKHEDDLIRPAVDGTTRVVTAAAEAGVKRVIYTSSTDTIVRNSANKSKVHTEDHWSDLSECTAYGKSKLLAERAAWDLAAKHDLELAVVIPGAIIGPQLQLKKDSSADIVRRMLAGEMPVVPRIHLAYSDVRDLATAHRLAMETPEASGSRYICAGEGLWMADIAEILKAEYGPKGYKISTRPLPTWIMRAAGRFSDQVRLASDMLGVPHHVSADKAKRELGWDPRPIRQTLLESAEDLISQGVIQPPKSRR